MDSSSSHLHCFQGESCFHPYLCCSVHNVPPPPNLAAFKFFSLSLALNILIMICLDVVLFMFLLLEGSLSLLD